MDLAFFQVLLAHGVSTKLARNAGNAYEIIPNTTELMILAACKQIHICNNAGGAHD